MLNGKEIWTRIETERNINEKMHIYIKPLDHKA